MWMSYDRKAEILSQIDEIGNFNKPAVQGSVNALNGFIYFDVSNS